jgi:hypothetical protein
MQLRCRPAVGSRPPAWPASPGPAGMARTSAPLAPRSSGNGPRCGVPADVEQPCRTAHDPEAHAAVVELHLDRADPPRAVAGKRHNRRIDTRLEASPQSGGSAGAPCSIYAHLGHTFRTLLSRTLRRSLDEAVREHAPVISCVPQAGSRSGRRSTSGRRRTPVSGQCPPSRRLIPIRACVVACLPQLATVDRPLRRYDTDGRRSGARRAARKPALSVQRKQRDRPARTIIPRALTG